MDSKRVWSSLALQQVFLSLDRVKVSSSKATPATAALEQKNRISLVSAPFIPFSVLFYFVFNPSFLSLTLK